ncbi:MAG TPA: hypothetical protein PKA44_08355 [Saprospiraceae bacterium]|mgnify:CR=1 FL=1|jgi:hypothetical protein|nr:hypothetical protein [Saprospiraceae bacterium]HMU59910.1 hypothetical protein [Chitinophagaceae bacterium]
MAFNEPDNALIFQDFSELKNLYNSFREKYSDIFEQDADENYIDFNWNSLPENVDNRQKFSFDIKYSELLPQTIKNEFEDRIKDFVATEVVYPISK